MLSLTVNLSTWEVIRRYLSFSAPHGVISDLSALLWSSSSGEMDLLLPIKERVKEREEWNLTSDVLSWLTDAWQRRSGLSFSGRHTDEYEDELPLWLSPTFYEYHLSGLCFFSSKLHNHIRTLSNCSWQNSTACYFAECKSGDICHLTLLKLHSKSQLTLNGFKRRAQMFSDVQCFIPLKLLNHSSLLAYSG